MMWRSVHDDDDDEIIDGPFDVDDADIEHLAPGSMKVSFEAVLDHETFGLAIVLAEREGVTVTEAVRRAVRAQAAALTTAPSGAPSPRAPS